MLDEEDFEETPPFQPLYDLAERVKEANLELETLEAPSEKQPRPARVKFKEEVTEFEFWDSEEEWSGEGLLTSTKEEDAAVLISDDEIELLPLEDEVRMGFPHGAELPHEFESDEEAARPRVGPSSVEEEQGVEGEEEGEASPGVRSIAEELGLHLDLRDMDETEDADEVVYLRAARPWTAPSAAGHKHRDACKGRWTCAHLPHYNGLRSEYGLSKEQLDERRRLRRELHEEKKASARRQQREQQERRDENERVFRAWLARKQNEKLFYAGGGRGRVAEEQKVQTLLVEARRREAEQCYREWLRNKRLEKRLVARSRNNNTTRWTIHDFERILGSMDQHTERTFRIYLGFSK
ncbi:Hypothetical predicted protein [Cloeon dipterum]|uniref:Coiled-coil domain-containing protein 181 n=2 Tax=Cloeon dipterum TaxID=197152 RepID=A0A8S1DSK3_9INSE|nr:Hypothetical predicted protein [Cloeon dipterum]